MKLKDVQIGGRYLAKVSGRVQVVRITRIAEDFDYKGRSRTHIHAVNEATGRSVLIRSPQRLRGPANNERTTP